MDNFQDFLTLAATVVEYFFFAYLAVAFIIYSIKSPYPVQQPHVTTLSQAPASQTPTAQAPAQTAWERSLDPETSFAAMASS
jgi:hypothetical protein